jgi:hypothetical protein
VRAFRLRRGHDETGVSGTGVVLDGVVFDDGVTVVHWRGRWRSTAVFGSFEEFLAVHVDAHPANRSVIEWSTMGDGGGASMEA